MALNWSREEVRLYQLAAVGLHGKRYPEGGDGIREAFRDLRAVQLDPLPILGRNHDLVLQSRVGGTHPGMFLDLLHHKRLGFEYWDKMLCAIPIAEFPYFRALMEAGGEQWERRREEQLDHDHPGAKDAVLEAVQKRGPLSTVELKELSVAPGAYRGWKTTQAAGAALEVLWNRGRLSVSHRTNYRRYFDLTERVVPPTILACPTPRGEEFLRYLLRKRVDMVGLLPTGGAAETWMSLQQARTDGLPLRHAAIRDGLEQFLEYLGGVRIAWPRRR